MAVEAGRSAAARLASFELARQRKRAAQRQEAVSRAREDARALAAYAREEFGARRVVLFGSLVAGNPSDRPDIDLAVEGIAPGRLTEALGELLARTRFDVDLVDLRSVSPTLRARIESDGVELA